MRQLRAPLALLFGALLAHPAPLLAQSTVSGSLRGTVSDAAGGPLPGVTVTAASDALVAGSQRATTDAQGGFRFPSLPPGIYKIEAALSGFRTVQQDGLRIRLGEALTLNLKMDLPTVTGEVVVTAEAPVVSVVSNASASNLTIEALDRLPIPRSQASAVNYAPGVNGGLAYGGTQTASNAYNLDGVNVSDPAAGGQWILPNLDWVKEVQVGGLGADAEYGGFTGATVNLVTKSGGNTFSGDVTVYYSGGGLNSKNSSDPSLSPATKDSDTDVSVNLGGAFVKDRVWFFVSGEEVRTKITPQAATNSEDTKLSRYLGKVSFQATEKSQIVGLVDYDGKNVDRRGISQYRLESASTRQESPNFSFNLSYNNMISSATFLDAKLTGFRGDDDRLPYGPRTRPGREDADTGYLWDNNKYTDTNNVKRTALDVAFNYFADGLLAKADTHHVKVGVTWETGRADETQTRNGGFSYYDDSSYCDSVAQYFAHPECAVYSSDRGGDIFLKSVQDGLSAYLQDSWQISRLTVNAGLRYTRYKGGFVGGNESVYAPGNLFSPRVGFVVDPLGDGKTAVKGHYGRYYEGLYAYLFDREQSGQVFTPTQYFDYNFDTQQFDIPAGGTTNRAALSGDIGHPYIDQFVASLERELARGVALGVDYTWRRGRDIVAMQNVNNDYEALTAPNNPLTGGSLPFFDLQSSPVFVIQNPDGAFRKYNAVTARLEKRWSHGWTARASVVWSDLKGNSFKQNGYIPEWQDRNGQVNGEGRLPGSNRWEAKLNGAVDLPLGLTASANWLFLSGEYWTPFVQVRGLYKNNPQNVFLEERGSEKLPSRSLFDVRLAKELPVGALRLRVFADCFNLFNSSTVTSVDTQWGRYNYKYNNHPAGSTWQARSSYGRALAIESPREVRLGARVSF